MSRSLLVLHGYLVTVSVFRFSNNWPFFEVKIPRAKQCLSHVCQMSGTYFTNCSEPVVDMSLMDQHMPKFDKRRFCLAKGFCTLLSWRTFRFAQLTASCLCPRAGARCNSMGQMSRGKLYYLEVKVYQLMEFGFSDFGRT
jgi:hypothetical protein